MNILQLNVLKLFPNLLLISCWMKLPSDSLPVFNELIVCEANIIQVTNNININP